MTKAGPDPGSATLLPDVCANCGTALAGPYCHRCGQRASEADALRLGPMIGRGLRRALALDSKTLRSLAGLFRPGLLTAEYLAGRRQRYLGPIKVYLIAAAVFFLAAPLAGFTFEALSGRAGMEWLQGLVAERMAARGMDAGLFAARFNLRLQTVYTAMLGVSVVGAALLLAALYWRQRRPAGAHVIFALHYVAFLYLAAIVLGAVWNAVDLHPVVALALTYGVVGPYLVIGLRRVYGGSLGGTIVKVFVLAAATLVLDSAVTLAALLLTLRLI